MFSSGRATDKHFKESTIMLCKQSILIQAINILLLLQERGEKSKSANIRIIGWIPTVN